MDAERWYKTVLKIDPKNLESLTYLRHTYVGCVNLKEAEKLDKQIQELKSTSE